MKAILTTNAITRTLRAAAQRAKRGEGNVAATLTLRAADTVGKTAISGAAARLLASARSSTVKTTEIVSRLAAMRSAASGTKRGQAQLAALLRPAAAIAHQKRGLGATMARGGLFRSSSTGGVFVPPPPAPTPAGLPAWMQAFTSNLATLRLGAGAKLNTLAVPGQTDIGSTSWDSHSVNPAAIRSYSGAATNGRMATEIRLFGGGHGTCWSNHIAAINLLADTPTFTVWAQPSPWSAVNIRKGTGVSVTYGTSSSDYPTVGNASAITAMWPATPDGAYTDGRPVGGHMGCRMAFRQSENRFYAFGSGTPYPGSTPHLTSGPIPPDYDTISDRVRIYDKATEAWLPSITSPAMPNPTGGDAQRIWYILGGKADPWTGDYWTINGEGTFFRFSMYSQTWASLGNAGSTESNYQDRSFAFDTKRRRVVVFATNKAAHGGSHFLWDMDANGGAGTPYAGNAAFILTSDTFPSKTTAAYDSINDCFWLYTGGVGLYKVVPTDVFGGTWQVTLQSLGSINGAPAGSSEGCYNAFDFSERLGILWYCDENYDSQNHPVDTSTYAIRVSNDPTQFAVTPRQAIADDGSADSPRQDQWNRRLLLDWKSVPDYIDATGRFKGATAFASTAISATTLTLTSTALRLLVTDWILNGVQDGFVISGGGSSSTIAGRASGSPPVLVINGTNYPCVQSACVEQGVYTQFDGRSTFQIGAGRFGLLRFDLTGAPTSVTSVSLRVTCTSSGGGTVAAYQLMLPVLREAGGGAMPEMGIANAYVRDAGLENHPDVFLNCRNMGSSTGWDRWFPADSTTEYLYDPASDSTYCRARMLTTENECLGFEKLLMKGTTTGSDPTGETILEAYARYYFYFESDWASSVDDNKMPGFDCRMGYWSATPPDPGYLAGGWTNAPGDDRYGNGQIKSDGKHYTSPYNVYRGQMLRGGSGKAPVGGMNAEPLGAYKHIRGYIYHIDQPEANGEELQYPNRVVTTGKWYCVEHRVKMNSLSGAADAAGNQTPNFDGVYEAWLDGVKVFSRTNLRFRCHPKMGIANWWAGFYHGGTAFPNQEMHVRLRNVVIARQYIGPMAGVPPNTYTTSFPLTELVISEGGAWTSNAVAPRTPVQTANGNAFGTMSSFDGVNFNDSAACLSQSFSADQQITATLYNNGAIDGLEAELLLRCDFSPTRAFCYELDLTISGQLNWVRWDMTSSSPNAFQVLVSVTRPSAAHYTDGAVWTARVVGTVLTAICDGVTVLTYDTAGDATRLSAGKPGMGFWNSTGSSSNSPKLGWKDFTATAI